jgi:hypothetical protein
MKQAVQTLINETISGIDPPVLDTSFMFQATLTGQENQPLDVYNPVPFNNVTVDTTNGDIVLNADGTLTFNEAGVYQVVIYDAGYNQSGRVYINGVYIWNFSTTQYNKLIPPFYVHVSTIPTTLSFLLTGGQIYGSTSPQVTITVIRVA